MLQERAGFGCDRQHCPWTVSGASTPRRRKSHSTRPSWACDEWGRNSLARTPRLACARPQPWSLGGMLHECPRAVKRCSQCAPRNCSLCFGPCQHCSLLSHMHTHTHTLSLIQNQLTHRHPSPRSPPRNIPDRADDERTLANEHRRIQDSKHNKIHVAVERSILDRIERMRNRFNCVFQVKLDGEEETIPVIIRSFQVWKSGDSRMPCFVAPDRA